MFSTLPKKVEEFERLIGFTHIKNQIEPKTPFGSRFFKYLEPLGFEQIVKHLDDTQLFLKLFQTAAASEKLLDDLASVIDISGSIERLKTGETLDEIELFEIKNYALVSENIRQNLLGKVPDKILPPSLDSIIEILDPEGYRLPTFYIYDAYSEELKEIRKRKREIEGKIQQTAKEPEEMHKLLNDELVELTNSEVAVERKVLSQLSGKLSAHICTLSESVERIKYIDVIIAKARLAIKLGLSKPVIFQLENSAEESAFSINIDKMFNPQLRDELIKRGKDYQLVDISIQPGVTVIVGANMSGKSVVLRTVALIQYMTQLGFFVPAKNCQTVFLEHIAVVCEDNQKTFSGISSFGAEILLVNDALLTAKKSRGLVVLDEPARTTNPYEGAAIVNAIVENFKDLSSYTLIVTHFDDIYAPRRLRVKGLKEDIAALLAEKQNKTEELIGRLQDFIDYQLVESFDLVVPKEATKVMELLGIEPTIVDFVKKRIDEQMGR